MTDEFEMTRKGAVVVYVNVLSRHSPGGTEENNEKPASIICVPAEIPNWHLPNTSQKRYVWTNLLGSKNNTPCWNGEIVTSKKMNHEDWK
jgi:hypothetical protein